MLNFRRAARRLAMATVAGFIAAPTVGTTAMADSRPDIVIAVNKLPRGMEPGVLSGNVDVRVNYSVFDTLIKRDFIYEAKTDELRHVPGLATSWKVTGPRTMELELRQGVKWHDGTEFTAEDVVFSFGPERVYGEGAPVRSAKIFVGDIDKVEALGKYKVRITWKHPEPLMAHRLSGYRSWIVQKANYTKFQKGDTPSAEWMKKAVKEAMWHPQGTGPYRFVEYRPGQHVKLAANDDYFMGPPAAKTVTFKEVPEVSARIAGIVSGEFDMIVEIPPDQVKVANRYDNVTTKDVVLENSHVLVFNTHDPVLKDQKLRQALSMAIDRKKLIQALWDGKTFTPNGNQFKNYGEYYVKDMPPYAYEPEKAKALLAESAYKGQEIEYRIIPNYYTNSMEAAQIMQAMWKDVGINVKITPVENFKAVRAKGAQIYPWSNTVRFPDPVGQLVLAWGPNTALQRKYKFWDGTEAFNEASRVLVTSVDATERKDAFARMLRIWREDAPGTILYNPVSTYGIRKGIEFTPYSLYYMDLRPDNLKVVTQN